MLPILLTLALAQAPDGAALFDTHCAACHSGTDSPRAHGGGAAAADARVAFAVDE